MIDQNLNPELPLQMMLLQDAFFNFADPNRSFGKCPWSSFFKPLSPWKKGTDYKLYVLLDTATPT